MNLSSPHTYSISLKMHEYQINYKISVQFLSFLDEMKGRNIIDVF